MLRVVYYARVSTEEEKQLNALEIQCQENEEFIESQKDWILVDKYIDEGRSGTTTEGRLELLRLIDDIKKDKFDVVLVKQIDRGWRNILDWKYFEYELYKNKKRLFIRIRKEFYNIEDDGSYISVNFDAFFSEWFSRNLSKKMLQAHQTRMKQGRTVITNGKMWGYNQVNGELVINEEEAKVVRFVFEQYSSGKGFRTIANELERMGIKNKNGNPFSLTTLQRMIRNEKYKGVLVCNKRRWNFFTKKHEYLPEDQWYVHENRIPPIVSEELWQKANDMINKKRIALPKEEKKKFRGYFAGMYPLSGKIVCGKCNRTYYHTNFTKYSTKYNHKKVYNYWRCQGYMNYGKKDPRGCDNIILSEREINGIVKKTIFNFLKNKDESINRVLEVLNKVLRTSNYQQIIDKLNSQKEKTKRNLEALLDNLLDGTISKEVYKNKEKQLNEKLQSIEDEIKTLEEKNKGLMDKRERLLTIKNKLNTELETEDGITDEMVNNLIDKVYIYPDGIIKISLLNDQTVEVKREDKNLKNVSADNLYRIQNEKIKCIEFNMSFKRSRCPVELSERNYTIQMYFTI